MLSGQSRFEETIRHERCSESRLFLTFGRLVSGSELRTGEETVAVEVFNLKTIVSLVYEGLQTGSSSHVFTSRS
jgi:hypothetical protein